MKTGVRACVVVLSSLSSVVALAHPGHSEVAVVHGDGIGVWLAHQLYNMDFVLTFVVLAMLVVLTGGRLFRNRGSFRRRRSRE